MCSTNKRINTLITGIKDNVNLTVTRGINISGTLGVWTYDFSIGLSFDAKGNVGIQHSFAGGVTASAAPVMGVPVYGSGDFVVTGDPNSSDKHYYGVTVAGGSRNTWWRSTCGNFYYKDGCINKCIWYYKKEVN